MGKKVFLAAVTIAVTLYVFAACTAPEKNGTADIPADAVSAATARKGPPARVLLKEFMPQAAADDVVKIAVLVNRKAGDISRLFIDGCVSEGRSMGFTVDAFVTGGDEKRCGELAAGIAQADYDGLIFAYAVFGDGTAGEASGETTGGAFTYDTLRPLVERGIKIVTYEALPVKDGGTISGITATSLDDYGLARSSIDAVLSYTGAERPARIIRIGTEANVPFMVRRSKAFDDYVNEGKIEEAAVINLHDWENPAAAREGLAAILPGFPPGSVDAVWSPRDEYTAGCAEALVTARRRDIVLTGIGISNEDIRLMQRYSRIWLANAAVDPRVAGEVNMRILAAKLAGEEPPGAFLFGPQLVKTAELDPDINTANIAVMVPGWGGGEGLFDSYPWMKSLKAAEVNYLRIPPAMPPTAQTAVPGEAPEA